MKTKYLAGILLLSALVLAFVSINASPVSAAEKETEIVEVIIDDVYLEDEGDITPVDLPDSDELLEGFLEDEAAEAINETRGKKLTKGADTPKRGKLGRQLTGKNQKAYDFLRPELEAIAEGNRDNSAITMPIADLTDINLYYTAEELGVDTLVKDGQINADALIAYIKKVDCFVTQNDVHLALLYDLPYDMYWFDKSKDTSKYNPRFAVGTTNLGTRVLFATNYLVELTVAEPYHKQGSEKLTDLDTTKTKAAATAAHSAGNIITTYQDDTDYNKVTAYKNEICELTSYDFDAAANVGTIPYGDPWQLIYVFDGKNDTKVVCEGYAKAFKFLCDLSVFRSNQMEAIIVSGTLSGNATANHMWNVLRMNDGKNYLVDVTNCDSEAVGYPDKVFLKGCNSGTVSSGYTFRIESRDLQYIYDDSVKNLYAGSDLTLSNSDYDPSAVDPDLCDHNMQHYAAKTPTCTQSGNLEYYYCTKCHKYFKDGNGGTEYAENGWVAEALGHDTQTETTTLKEATCTEGSIIKVVVSCKRCKQELNTQTIQGSAMGHQAMMPVTEVTQATCTTPGSSDRVVYCERCNAVISRTSTPIDPLGHDPGQPVKEHEIAATCTNGGSYDMVTYCKRCEDPIGTEHCTSEPLGHDPGQPVKEHEVAATCTSGGSYDMVTYCKRCEDPIGTENFKTDPLGHQWGDPLYTWSKDCSKLTATRKCSRNTCSECTETETVNTTAEVTRAATYTAKGVTTYTSAQFSNPAFAVQVKPLENIAKLAKKAQPMTVKTATRKLKVKDLKKKARTIAPITVKSAKGKVTYKVTGGTTKAKKALKLNTKTGKITVKRGTKKGTYKIKIKVTAAGTSTGRPQYKAGSKTVQVKVSVK